MNQTMAAMDWEITESIKESNKILKNNIYEY